MVNRLTKWLGRVMALMCLVVLCATSIAVASLEPNRGIEKEECRAEISGQTISLYFEVVERLERVHGMDGTDKPARRRHAMFLRGETGGTIAEQVVAILRPLFEQAVLAGGVRMGDQGVVRFRTNQLYEVVLQVNICTDGVVHGAPLVLGIFPVDECPALSAPPEE